MHVVARYLRLIVIAVAIAMCPLWPDLMGHASVTAPAADVLEGVIPAPFANAHFVLLFGMILGGLLLTVAPRIITEWFVATVSIAGVVGAVSILAYSQGGPVLVLASTLVSAVCFIVLYGATFYLLAGTAGYATIAVVSAGALALKAALLPGVEALPPAAAYIAICCVPLVCAGCALLYRHLCKGVSQRQEGALDSRSFGRRTSMFMAMLIAVSSVVFAAARASSDMQLWGTGNPILAVTPAALGVCTVVFLVMCYATFINAPRDLMLRFLPCLVVQLVAYGILWCGGLAQFGVEGGGIGEQLFNTYTELYSHMYFFMVMFMGLSMLGTAGVRVHGVQWMVFSAALFMILALGWTAATPARFFVVLAMNAVLIGMFLFGHGVYERDQVEAIKAALQEDGTLAATRGMLPCERCADGRACAYTRGEEAGRPVPAFEGAAEAAGSGNAGNAAGADPVAAGFSTDLAGTGEGCSPMEKPLSPLELTVAAVAERYALSDREREVLALLVQGRTRQYIGDQLYLASGTVGSYITRIYEKMRVHSKQELLTIVYDTMTERWA